MKLIVGLGNPGSKYEGTRHNIGFELLLELARRHGQGNPRQQFQGELRGAQIEGESAWLLRPFTYMNLSGGSVLAARDFYKLQNGEVLIVGDDFQLPLGKLRFRAKGSAGGQKGLADVLRRLGSDIVPRLRLGIGEPPPGWDPADFVLGKFTRQEQPAVRETVDRAAAAVAVWVREGIEAAMNRYN